ncbi:MAG: hypothetical protein AB8I08_40305 [Sandaracinaceae bacterium]
MDLVELVEEKSDSELTAMLEQPGDWTAAMRIAARAEMGRRGLPLPEPPAPTSETGWTHWLVLASVLAASSAAVAYFGLGPKSTWAFALPASACLAEALRRRGARTLT